MLQTGAEAGPLDRVAGSALGSLFFTLQLPRGPPTASLWFDLCDEAETTQPEPVGTLSSTKQPCLQSTRLTLPWALLRWLCSQPCANTSQPRIHWTSEGGGGNGDLSPRSVTDRRQAMTGVKPTGLARTAQDTAAEVLAHVPPAPPTRTFPASRVPRPAPSPGRLPATAGSDHGLTVISAN